MLRVLVIDDSEVFLDTIVDLLREAPEIGVVSTARNGTLGLLSAANLRPDLIFVDLHLPDMLGFEVVENLLKQQRWVRVIITSVHEEAEYRERALAAGAEDFICKDQLLARLPTLFAPAKKSGEHKRA